MLSKFRPPPINDAGGSLLMRHNVKRKIAPEVQLRMRRKLRGEGERLAADATGVYRRIRRSNGQPT